MIDLNADTYIRHGDLVTKADLQRKFIATAERRNKIVAMVKEGKSLDEIKAVLPDAPAPGAAPRGAAPPAAAAANRGGPPAATPLTFVVAAYREITKSSKN